jgi:hypothetical protein
LAHAHDGHVTRGRRAGCSHAARTSPHKQRGGTGLFYIASRTDGQSILSKLP